MTEEQAFFTMGAQDGKTALGLVDECPSHGVSAEDRRAMALMVKVYQIGRGNFGEAKMVAYIGGLASALES